MLSDFDAHFYRSAYGDLRHLSEDELRGHWLGGGRGEGRVASAAQLRAQYPEINWDKFDGEAFLEANPDIPEMTTSAAAIYYARYGRAEERPIHIALPPTGVVAELAVELLPPELLYERKFTTWRELFRAVDDAVDSGFAEPIEKILEDPNDRSMIIRLVEAIHRRSPSPSEVERWHQMLVRRGRPFVVASVVRFFARDSESMWARTGNEWDSGVEDGADFFRILGSKDEAMRFSAWHTEMRNAALVGADESASNDVPPPRCAGGSSPRVSVICSLYRGGEYIRNYMDNITRQVGFDRHELVIVDAASPDREFEVINEYLERHSNIVYRRLPERIGIYEAWNVGIGLSSGEYLTNANLDDMRNPRSLDEMAAFLDNAPEIDVVYSDTLYTLKPHIDWATLEKIDARTDLPPITTWNILDFNSPHCAPMWRRSLHDDLALFDDSFVSAGDWEFWVRCANARRRFHKLPTPLIGYYLNPEGISTSSNSRGIREQWPIRERYRDMLLLPEECLDPLRLDEFANPTA